MKRVLALIGSPRKLGNCEIMVKEISRRIETPHELRMVRLSEFDIRPCRACYACLFGDGGCPIDDDFDQLLQELLAADAYIAATPTYLLGANSVFKRFSDRGLALYPHLETLWGRPAVGLGVAGIEGREGCTVLGVESFLKFLMAEVKGVRMVYGALPGEVFDAAVGAEVAAELASALFGAACRAQGPTCPVCGGSTFRFLGADRVHCMLCSNQGTLSWAGGEARLAVETGEHELFTSRAAAIEHREWLRGMKERFLEERSRLREVTAPYRDQGEWVRPES